MDIDPVSLSYPQGSSQEAALNTSHDVSQIHEIKDRIFNDFLHIVDETKKHSFSFVDLSLYYFISRYKSLLYPSWVNEQYEDSLLLLESIVSSAEQQLLSKIKLSAELNIIKNETDLIPCFEAAVKSCRQQELYLCEYLIKQLFVNEILLNLNSSEEEIHKAIEIKLDLLNSFKRFTVSEEEAQVKYEQHFENYLNLLGLLFKIPLESCKTLSDKFSTVDIYLGSFLVRTQEDKRNLASYHCSYLRSRKEWFFKNDMNQAWLFLLEVKRNATPKNEMFNAKVETRILALEFYDREALEPAGKEQLVSWMKRIIALKISNKLSSSDYVEITFLQAKIYEQLLLQEPENASLRTSFRTVLEELVNFKKEALSNLNFTALQTLSKASFELGFHLIFHSNTIEDREEGIVLLKKIIENFWADPEIAAGAHKLVLCIPYKVNSARLVVPSLEKEQLLYDFKSLLLGDMQNFLLGVIYGRDDIKVDKFWQAQNLIDPKEVVREEALAWSNVQEQFISLLDVNNIKESNSVFNTFVGHLMSKTGSKFNGLYGTYDDRRIGFFSLDVQSHDQESNILALKLRVGLVENFFQQAKLNPGLEVWLPVKEQSLLDSQFFMGMGISIQKQSKTINMDFQMPCHSSTYFLSAFDACCDILSSLEGKIAYGSIIQSVFKSYAYTLQLNPFLYDVMSPKSKASKSNDFFKIRHHIPTMQNLGRLVSLRRILSYICFSNIQKASMDLYNVQSIETCSLMAGISPQISDKIQYLKEINCVFGRQAANHKHELGSKADREEKILRWHNLAIMFILANNFKEKFGYAEEVFPYLPDNFAEFQLVGEQCSEFHLTCLYELLIMKALYLIYKGKREKGFNLIEDYINYCSTQTTNTRQKRNLVKFKKLAFQGQLIHKIECKTTCKKTFIDPKKLKYGAFYEQSQLAFNSALHQVSSSSLPPHKESTANTSKAKKPTHQHFHSSLRNPSFDRTSLSSPSLLEEMPGSIPSNVAREVRRNALELLKKEQLKEEKKSHRIHSSLNFVKASESTSALSESHLDRPSFQAKITLSHRNMRIFEQFWIKNDPEEQGSWETLSFRNNFSIKRNEALKLIVALGGRYSPSRGHGSHHVSHLPKIEFNDCDVGGLVDFESGELMITLTKDEYLKYYQIVQLRGILIQQGFTPDTVSKQQNPETE